MLLTQLAHGEGMPVGLHKRAYILLLCMAFCNELLAIFTSSLAITRLLQKRHDPMAENAAQMMVNMHAPPHICIKQYQYSRIDGWIINVQAPMAGFQITRLSVALPQNSSISMRTCVGFADVISMSHGSNHKRHFVQLREYPLYFMAVRVHFITGLLFFAGGLAIRMYIEYSSGCSRFAR